MEQVRHTSGKWVINYDGSIYTEPTENDKYGRCICRFSWNSFKEFNEGNNEANARLIATAPELLEACKELLVICERFDQHEIDCATQAATVADEFAAMGCTCGLSKAKSAIAKAERR